MPNWLPPDVYEDNRDSLVNKLGDCLYDGTLALCLGAGTSVGIGLPKWDGLIVDCYSAAGLGPLSKADVDSTDKVLARANELSRQIPLLKLQQVVKEALYKSCGTASESTFLEQKLLIAIGSMLMKSRRGSVSEVLTFNFDDVLERYLRLHGFLSQVVCSLPCLRAYPKTPMLALVR